MFKRLSKNRISCIAKSAFSGARNILNYISFFDFYNFCPFVILLLFDLQNAYCSRKSKFQNEIFFLFGNTRVKFGSRCLLYRINI